MKSILNNFWILLSLVLLLVGISACSKKDDDPAPVNQSILEDVKKAIETIDAGKITSRIPNQIKESTEPDAILINTQITVSSGFMTLPLAYLSIPSGATPVKTGRGPETFTYTDATTNTTLRWVLDSDNTNYLTKVYLKEGSAVEALVISSSVSKDLKSSTFDYYNIKDGNLSDIDFKFSSTENSSKTYFFEMVSFDESDDDVLKLELKEDKSGIMNMINGANREEWSWNPSGVGIYKSFEGNTEIESRNFGG